ncbi:transglutaminase-like domain-containing protein [Persicobacter diffluens]|uniref:transglutaminase domain-containing protein n=1 Tax=Persicobacter diffluens TaxID=981 RepID=UPI0030C743E1
MKIYRNCFFALVILFSLLAEKVSGQEKSPYEARARKEIQQILTRMDFGEDSLRAAFEWVAKNYTYDLAFLRAPKTYESNYHLVWEALKKRKGVCQHYAETFHLMMEELGYPAYVVSGYVLDVGKFRLDLGHSWNAVKTAEGWFLFDPTWASGTVDERGFHPEYQAEWFRQTAKLFFERHIPFDPFWQLTDSVFSHQQVIAGVEGQKPTLFYPVAEVWGRYEVTSVDWKEQEVARIRSAHPVNELTKTHLKRMEEQLRVRKYNVDAASMNAAVETLNKQIEELNAFYRKLSSGKVAVEDQHKVMLAAYQQLEALSVQMNGIQTAEPVLLEQLSYNQQVLKEVMSRLEGDMRKMNVP